jgi:hypothetical protein
MGKRRRRYVAKAAAGAGWRIWDNIGKRWWGEHYRDLPGRLLSELNGAKRPDRIRDLIRLMARKPCARSG